MFKVETRGFGKPLVALAGDAQSQVTVHPPVSGDTPTQIFFCWWDHLCTWSQQLLIKSCQGPAAKLPSGHLTCRKPI